MCFPLRALDSIVSFGWQRRRSLQKIFCETQNGCTALILAVLKGRADCVRVLVEAGADKDATDNVCYNACALFLQACMRAMMFPSPCGASFYCCRRHYEATITVFNIGHPSFVLRLQTAWNDCARP